jgi:hypothetical protein
LNPTAIFSKTGKGVQEASGKTSNLSRADRAVLKEIDGKTALGAIAAKFEKIPADKFTALIQQFDKDGYIREVSSGVTAPQAPPARSAPPPKAAPPPASDGDDEMDFTQAIKLPPKAAPAAPKPPTVDLAAASRADAERKAKEQQAFDYKARQEAEAKAKAEAEKKAKAEAELKARAAAEAKARAEAEAKARAEAEGKARAEAEAKVKAAREAAVRMATEVRAKAEAEGNAKAEAAAQREREALEKARRESEDKARLEAELTGKLEEERRAREDAERRAREAADQARREMEEKARRDADELRQRLEAEMKAKLEEERKAREAEDRKRREEEDRKRAEEDRKRREEDDRRRKEEEERRAKEDAERRARAEEDRKRREEDDRKRAEEEKRRKDEEARRAKEEAERRAREEADREAERKRREEDDRKRAEEDKRRKEEEARRAKDEAERRAKEEAERRAKEDADRKAKEEAEQAARAAQAAAQSASQPSIQPVPAPPPPPAPAAGVSLEDSLLADLESFGKREEEEQKAKEEAERRAKEEAARKAKAEAERRAKDDAERRAKEEADRKRREEEERKAKEEAERAAREAEERQKQEEAERKRKARESLAAKEAERKAAQGAAAAKVIKPAKPAGKSAARDDDDIGVTDDDLDMDDVKKDEKALSATVRKAARERDEAVAAVATVRRPRKWGKPAAIVLFALLIGGVGVLELMPVSTAEYEKAASDAMGVPVKIGSAHLSVITGIEARFDAVSVGDSVKIRTVRGHPEIGSLLGGKKSFSRIELEGVSLSQSQLADAVLGKVSGENLRVGRVLIKQAKLDGPLALPALDVEAVVAGDGSLQSVFLRGGDKLVVQLSPKGNDIGFEISAGTLALPVAPALTLSDFSMKGTANRNGVTNSEFDGRASDGVISGTAKIRWGANWSADGEIRVRNLKVAVLAPALVSEGKAEGRGAYSMSGPKPAALFESGRIQGEFKIEQGVLGSFDLTRALQTGGAQSTGRTIFSELTGQAVYEKGTVKITNASITAGAMNAGASLDIDANGGLSGRVVADVKTPTQTLRATLNLSGKIQDPVIRK